MLLGAVLGLAGACGGGKDRPNVLVIVIDTLRADRLGSYGAERDTSPRLDALAAEGVRFARAYSPAPWTRPSVATILTGLYPSGHGVVGTNQTLGADTPTLATILAGEGYATAAVNSNKIVNRAAYGHGFGLWDQDEAKGPSYLTTPGVTRRAKRLLQKLVPEEAPFFLYVHYMDPHVNYLAHEELGFAKGPVGRLQGGEAWSKLHELRENLTPDEVEFLHALYDGEIRVTDGGIGELLDTLRALGAWDDTVIAVTADHGEELLDHGFIGHTRSLYEELLHVPLIVKPAGPDREGRVVEEPVTIVSLAPTVLELAGVRAPGAAFQAPSLVAAMHGTAPPRSPIYAEVDFVPPETASLPVPEVHKRSLALDGFKLIVDERTEAVELYDLSADPGESSDLRDERPELVRRLMAELAAAEERSKGTSYVAGERELTAEDVDDLRKLGYAE